MGTATTRVAEYLELGRAAARALGKDKVLEILTESSVAWDEVMRFTFWKDGITSTAGGTEGDLGKGQSVEAPWLDYVDGLLRYSKKGIAPKTEGLVLSHGVSRYGGSSDAECELRTALFGDADHVGGPEQLLKALKASRLAFVVQESASHTPANPRWHLEIPLARPLVPTSTNWKSDLYCPQYGWILGWLSELAQLDGMFDPSTCRLLQPVYPACRRTAEGKTPATTWSEGRALDWSMFLEATGYEAPKPQVQRWKIADLPSAERDQQLLKAFEADGLVIRHGGDGKYYVRCPNASAHSHSGNDTSSVLFTSPGRVGWYHCSHAHCADLDWEKLKSLLSRGARELLKPTKEDYPVELLAFDRPDPNQVTPKPDWVATFRRQTKERLSKGIKIPSHH